MSNIYNRPAKPAEPGPLAKEIGARAAEEFRKLTMKSRNREAIEALEKQASEWRGRAEEGRAYSALDPEVRQLLVRKAEAAEAEARRLSGEDAGAVDLGRADRLELEAAEHDRKAVNVADPGVRAYHRDLARECRATAALLRGEPPE